MILIKEKKKKILEIFKKKLLDKQYKICYNIYDLKIELRSCRIELLRRRGTVSLPSANSTACAIMTLDR